MAAIGVHSSGFPCAGNRARRRTGLSGPLHDRLDGEVGAVLPGDLGGAKLLWSAENRCNTVFPESQIASAPLFWYIMGT